MRASWKIPLLWPALLLAFALPPAARGQDTMPDPGSAREEEQEIPPDATLVDGIAAVVGREVILLSEVEEQLVLWETQMPPAVRDTLDRNALREHILQSLVENYLLVAEANRAGIKVTTAEETEGVDRQLENIRRNFPSEEAFQEELARAGMDMTQLRQSLRDEVRRQLLAQRVIQEEVYKDIRITDEDVRAFYQEHRAEVPDIPETVVLDHILVTPRVSDSSAVKAIDRLGSIRRELAQGADFADLARRYSEAPGADRGGELGTFRRGDLDPAFAAAESAAFALSPGEVSEPVRTQLGLHLIRTEERRGDQVRARQILIRLTPSASDSAEARALAEEIWRRARAGEDFGDLARAYSDDDVSRAEGGRLGAFEWTGLTDTYRKALSGLVPGDMTRPLSTPQGLQIVRLVSREESRAPIFEEIEPQLRELLADEKAREKYDEWVANLREHIYIRIVRTGGVEG